MIHGVTIQNYKSLRAIDGLPLARFQALVGPNAAGKSTFLDALDFVRDCLDQSPTAAVERRAREFDDLTFMRSGGRLQIALWLAFEPDAPLLQYRLVVGHDQDLGITVDEEELVRGAPAPVLPGMAPAFDRRGRKRLVWRTPAGRSTYQRENSTYQDVFDFAPDRLSLSMLPPDSERYPTANRTREYLLAGIRYLQLNSRSMRQPCPATRPAELELDGSNMARVVGRLLRPNGRRDPSVVERWIQHLRYALPDLEGIDWGTLEPDNAEYLVLRYGDGLRCPIWLASDGTLRTLALTLPAFLDHQPGVYLVEEPENGVHPKALEIVLRSLATMPYSQVLLATHSPLVVQQVGRQALLCFSRDTDGVRIVRGEDHPVLRDWDGEPDLATIYASGILS